MPVPQAQGPIRFGPFEVDLRAGELRKQGTKIRLQEQPFQVLQALLALPGQLITREELQQKIWPADTFVDFDHGLNNAIRRLREALSDSAESPRFIETLAKRGYRFIGPVEHLGDGAHAFAAAVPVDSIVVLPFTSLSPDPEDEFFTDGITEEIINALAQIKELHVVARSSAFSFKGKHIDPRIVGEQLNVRTVLEGSVRRADNRLRITAQLVNAADGYHLWSERYDRQMKDVFEIQDEIARSIAGRLKVTLEGRQEPLVTAGTKNLEAYQLYLKGRVLLPRRGPAVAYLACFERAVGLDANYAQAWAGLADSYTVLGYSGLLRPEASMSKALEAARRAVALDASLAEAHNALAMASLMGAWDKAEAEREFLRALELNPRYIQARTWYAMYYLMFSEGRMAEAMAQAKLALQSDPLSSYAHTMYGFICGYAGEYTEAIDAARRAVELDSESYLARFALQEVLRVTGKFEESVAAGELALAVSGRHSWAMVFLSLTLADWSKPVGADAIYAEMLARARRQYVAPAALAVVASAAAREKDAIGHARDALKQRDPECLFVFSRYGRTADLLYAYPRFREIIATMGRTDWLRD
jgi:TolB-like protein/Flp pilus assembly protein TadD